MEMISLTIPASLAKCFFGIQNIFYEQSIFFAANNQAVAEKSHQYKDLSWTQKIKIGVIKGVENVLIGYLIIISLGLVLSWKASGKEATVAAPSLLTGCAMAVLEEVLFRGILRTSLAGYQKIALYFAPQYLQNNRVFKWITSPSARIISINLMFAGIHLFNGGGYLNDKASLIQASRIMLQPVEGILYETTGDIIAPMVCHLTNNILFLI